MSKVVSSDPGRVPLPYRYMWWTEAEDPEDEQEEVARANDLIEACSKLENLQRDVHQQNLWNAQLYSNRELANFDWGTGSYYRASLSPVSNLGENLVLQVVDTLVTQVGKNRPKARPVTHGASFKLKNQAKLLDHWLYGEFMRQQVHRKGKRVFRDGSIFGFGAFHVGLTDGQLEVERVFPDEVIVDQQEVVSTGDLRTIFRRRVLPVDIVADVWDMNVEDIRQGAVTEYTDYRHVGPDYIVVVEAWRAARGGDTGKYMAVCKGHVLEEETWDHEWLPWVFFHYQDPMSGFYGPSAVEIALPYQIRLNELNEVIRDAQDIMGRPRVLVAEGTRVSPQEIDNLVARIIRYTGIKPEAVTWPAIAPELYNERERVVRTCFEQFGMGQLVSQAKLPDSVRLDSGPALREATSFTDGRMSDLVQRFEEMYLDLAETMIRVQRAFGGRKGETTWVGLTGTRVAMERIRWRDIDLDENAFTLTLEASSVQSMTPAARRDQLEDWRAKGEITEERYMQLLANPDLESETSVLSAAADDIDRVIEALYDGNYEPPAEEQDLVKGVQRVTLALLALRKYEEYGAGELFHQETAMVQWLARARDILQRASEATQPQPQAAATAAPMPVQPIAPPQPAPAY